MKANQLARAAVLVGLAGLWFAPGSRARTWIINPGGIGDAPTIQAGIDSAAAGDSVLLADGIFSGPGNRDISFRGKAIVVASLNWDWGGCMIDCGGSAAEPHRGFIADQGESLTTVLMEVGIENGYAEYDGGGLICGPSGEEGGGCPIIADCAFVNCTSGEDGGAILVYQGGYPLIIGCWFNGNSAGSFGGALYAASGTVVVMNSCEFHENHAYWGGAVSSDGGPIAMNGCRFVGNRATGEGGAMNFSLASVEITGCTSIGNRSSSNGGSIYAHFAGSHSGAGLYISGSSFIADSSEAGAVIACGGATGSVLVEETVIAFGYNSTAVKCYSPIGSIALACCDIYGNALGDWVDCIAGQSGTSGNFSEDPRFCDIEAGDGGLEDCSPCLPGGNSCGQLVGAWTSFCACGGAAVPTTWGSIKAMYK